MEHDLLLQLRSVRGRAPHGVTAFVMLLTAVLPAALTGQETDAERTAAAALGPRLSKAFKAIEDPMGQGFADLDAVWAELGMLEARFAELSAERGAKATFIVMVRKALIRLRQGRLDQAAVHGRSAYAFAIGRDIWSGSMRPELLAILEQCLPDAERRAVFAAEREYLFSAQAVEDAPHLADQTAMLRSSVQFDGGDDGAALGALRGVVDGLLSRATADPLRVRALSRLVWELLIRGDFAGADVYLKELPAAQSRYPRGVLALRRGDYELARRAGRALARSGEKKLGRFLEGEALENLGRTAEAVERYRDLLGIVTEPFDRVVAIRSLGDCELALWRADRSQVDRLAAAEARYREALSAAERDMHTRSELLQVHARLGEVVEARGDPAAAVGHYRRSLALLDATRGGVASDLFGRSWLRDDHLRAIDGVLRCADAAGLDAFDVLAVLELGKARTLLDWTARPPGGHADVDLLRAIRGVVLTDDPAELEARLRALESERGAGTTGQVEPLDANALRGEVLSLDGIAVSYWLGDERCHVSWVGAAGAVGGTLDLGPTERALALLGAARRAVESPPAVGASAGESWAALDAATSFFVPEALVRRLAAAGRIVFCPDDRLGRLPFEALRVNGVPLGVRVPIERAPSLSVRAAWAARGAAAGGGAVALVDSVVAPEAEARLALDPLAYSAREAQLVERAYPGRIRRLTGAEPTHDRLRDLLQSGEFDLVHVNAHAIENAVLPTSSVLLLADGPAALPALFDLPLDGALLVLSACRSAGGERRRGEGEVGLLGWPCAAGARAAVASLWHVNQQSTADLMGQFHAFRAAGHDPADAMRRARAVLFAAPQYAHPHYWAGFGVFGGGATAAVGGVAWSWWLGALAAIGALVALAVAVARRGR